MRLKQIPIDELRPGHRLKARKNRRIGDAIVVSVEKDVITIQTFVWQNTCRLSQAEVCELFGEAVEGSRE